MAVTVTTEGLHTATVNYDAGDLIASIRSAILSFITGHGWELVESTTNSDVFKSLDTGGTAGNSAHYSIAELDYSVTDRLCLHQWLSWAAGVGTSKSQNLKYVSSAQANAGTATESQAGQPLAPSLGGFVQLNVARGRLYVYGSTVGLAGNIVNNGGSLIIERTRVHASDAVGGAPGCLFCHTGQIFYPQSGVSNFKFSMPKDLAGGANTTQLAGDTGGFRIPETSEYYPYYPNYYHTDTPAMSANDGLDGTTNAGAIYPIVGCHPAATYHVRFGPLQGAARRYGSSPGDILTVPADANGIPVVGGTPTEYLVVSGGIALVR